ncbi:MAG: DUF488 domain-containing protein [Acidobacteriota bacterium]
MSQSSGKRSDVDEATVWTVGHSTHTADDFIKILKAHEISALVDVRSFPGSRRYPHFNQQELAGSLRTASINYHHLPSLGGRRRPLPNSRNTAWRNASFRAYADYMESPEFKDGIQQLLVLACADRTAIMCAEALWWRCHRGLVSDYLKAHGSLVLHIMNEANEEPHPYTSAANVINGELSYVEVADEQQLTLNL